MSKQINVLIITAEDTGLQMGCYGDPYAQTPCLNAFAAAGARFDNAYVTQAVCSPGRASILTGLYPHQNGQMGLATHRFSMFHSFPSLPTLLKQSGYRTGRIGKLHVLPETAFDFDFAWAPYDKISFAHRDIAATAQSAGDFMGQSDEPFFLMVNYADAHLPWIDQSCGLPANPLTADDVQVPAGVGVDSPRLRAVAASYYNCVSRLDSGIGMLLNELEKSGKADNTLVIFIADHGPQFSRGKCAIYELAIRTPLLVRWPGVSNPNVTRQDLVSQIDVLPTVLDATGVTYPNGWLALQGKSVRPLLRDTKPAPWREMIFAEWNNSHPDARSGVLYPQRSVRDKRYKLILSMMSDQPNPVESYYTQQTLVKSGANQEEIDNSPGHVRQAYRNWRTPNPVELYDLASDPHEFHNLADDPALAPTRKRLLSALKTWQTQTQDVLAQPGMLDRFIAETRATEKLAGGHKSPDFNWEYTRYLAPRLLSETASPAHDQSP